MEKLPSTYAAVLHTLIELYDLRKRPVKSKEIAKKLNINEGTIRNIMISLKIMGFIDSKTGPYGGYVPTQKAYEFLKSPSLLPIAYDIVPIIINSVRTGVYVASIELLDILNPLGNRAIIRIVGNVRDIKIGDKVRIGPTINSRIIIEGIVVDKSQVSNEIVIQIQKLIAIPKVKVCEIMSRNLLTVHVDTSLREAAKIFASHRIRALPVVDNESRIVGLLTTSDLAQAFSKGDLNAKARDYMRREVPVINSESDIFDAIKIMSTQGIGRLIVIDSSGKPIGMITRTDVLKYLAMLD